MRRSSPLSSYPASWPSITSDSGIGKATRLCLRLSTIKEEKLIDTPEINTLPLEIMCTRYVYVYACGHKTVQKVQCASASGNSGRCPSGTKDKVIPQDDLCDNCAG